MPKLTLALALCVLVALAGTLSYSAYLVVGVLADYLGTGRGMAGLLLGALFARFPWASKGKLRIVGLLPRPVRRPVMASLLALCLLYFLSRVWVSESFGTTLQAFVTQSRMRARMFAKSIS
ncbi:hypothetical protein [Massilia aerilata]|uniref:MFS transporter n=1 Tax=Massilia aerilata TaxID=453817 RepID=A0ABW0RZ59_9BURK